MTHAPVERPLLLLVDDDDTFRQVLSAALARRGFEVLCAANVPEAMQLAEAHSPEYAVVDLKMPGPSGLALIKRLKELDAETRMVMLTGYASIATAVEAVKLGATHYLAKPAYPDEIIAAFHKTSGDTALPFASTPLSVDRLEWEHIQRVLAEHDGNISATARALSMHRRTLQRKLGKNPSKK